MFKARVYDNTKTGEPIKNLKVNSNWFQRNKKKLVSGTIVLALCLFGLYQCSKDDDKEAVGTFLFITDKIGKEDGMTTDKDDDQDTKEDDIDTIGGEEEKETTNSINTNRTNQTNTNNNHSDSNKSNGNSGNTNKNDNNSSSDDKKPDSKPDDSKPTPKPDPKPDPTPKPDSKPDPTPKPDPKPDPEPEKPAEGDRKPIKDDEDRQPNIGGNEGDFVLEAYDEVELDQSETTLYRSDVPHMEEQDMSNYSVRIEYLEGLKTELEQIATEEVSFTR